MKVRTILGILYNLTGIYLIGYLIKLLILALTKYWVASEFLRILTNETRGLKVVVNLEHTEVVNAIIDEFVKVPDLLVLNPSEVKLIIFTAVGVTVYIISKLLYLYRTIIKLERRVVFEEAIKDSNY